jgi:hypothetical protein
MSSKPLALAAEDGDYGRVIGIAIGMAHTPRRADTRAIKLRWRRHRCARVASPKNLLT